MDDLSHAIYGGHEGMHSCCEQDADKTPNLQGGEYIPNFRQDRHSR